MARAAADDEHHSEQFHREFPIERPRIVSKNGCCHPCTSIALVMQPFGIFAFQKLLGLSALPNMTRGSLSLPIAFDPNNTITSSLLRLPPDDEPFAIVYVVHCRREVVEFLGGSATFFHLSEQGKFPFKNRALTH